MIREYLITLTAEELGILNEAVVQMPYAKVAALIGKIRTQIHEQEDSDKLNELANDIKQKQA